MKKVLCIVLSLMMILPIVASAAVTGEVGYYESAQNVYIAGDLAKADVKSGSMVTLTIKDSSTGDIKYINEVEVGENLRYETKFKFTGNLANCVLNVKEGDNDVSESVTVATVLNPGIYSVTLRDEDGSQRIEAGEIVSTVAHIENKYEDGGNYQILIAFYDENNKMIGCKEVASGTYDFHDLSKEVSVSSGVAVPSGTEKIKAFMWKNTQTMIPIAKEHVKEEGDKKFGGDNDQITVAFIGDSITYQGYYMKNIEHYYHTRYPNKDIIFVNKGIGGNTYTKVINRFDWDITENGYSGKIDEAIVFLGYNDAEPPSYVGRGETIETAAENAYINGLIDTYAAKCEEVIKMCQEKGISLTLFTPVVYDPEIASANDLPSYPKVANDYGLAEMTQRVLDLAKDYDLPVIDMWTPTNEYSDAVKNYTGNRATQVIAGPDGIHPEELGGVYMAYQFVKQQDGNPIVAKVEIDAQTAAVSTERADVTLTSADEDSVVYEYLAHGLPFVYTNNYKKHDEWLTALGEKTITEAMNKEIIRVTGLAEGNYKITIEGSELSDTYTNAELAEGVNIAIDAKNPAQVQSKASWDISYEKAAKEKHHRLLFATEEVIKDRNIDISKYDEDPQSVLQAISGTQGTGWYFLKENVSSDPDRFPYANYAAKKFQAENWLEIQELGKQAKELAQPVQRTVVIEKVQ